MDAVRRWLGAVWDEVTAPDLWAELQREQDALRQPNAGDTENTPFTNEELLRLSAQIAELKTYAQNTYDLSQAQQRELEGRLDYVEGVARRGLGRIDWWNLCVGALLNLAITQLVPPAAVQTLLVLAAQGLAGVFGGGVPELPGGGPIAPV